MLQRIPEGFALVLVLLMLVWFASFLRPAHADHHHGDRYYDEDPRYFSDIQNPPHLIIQHGGYHRDGRYEDPRYFSDIQERPDLIIYPGGYRHSQR